MNQIRKLTANGISVELPSYFPSISSFKTSFRPSDCLKLMGETNQMQFLVSAFDLVDEHGDLINEMIETLNAFKKEGKAILLDSGNYEKYWLKDTKWNIDLHEEVLKQDFCTFCFSFDGDYQTTDHLSDNDIICLILHNWESNSKATNGIVAPIIHSRLDRLDKVCTEVAKNCNANYIAIPERELGSGILARYDTVKKLRAVLNDVMGRYIPIHILGTGNPFSLLILSYAGADTFDGLEWCQTAINKDYRVYHFQLDALFNADNVDPKNYDLKTLVNNLMAYNYINKELQIMYKQDKIMQLLAEKIPASILEKLI